MSRHLDWPDCSNVRDLGGLPTLDGSVTRRGAAIRSDSLDRLTADGWRALQDYGVRTIIDLRNEIERDAEPYSCDLTMLAVPVEDDTDSEFVARWRPFSTPHYYRAALDRWPTRTAAAVRAFVDAPAGGVVIHCGLGRDRTGLVTMLLLAVAGVGAPLIADDYEMSAGRLPPLDVEALLAGPSNVNPRTGSQLEEDLATERRRRDATTDRQAILELLATVDVEGYLLDAGLTAADIAAARARLVGVSRPSPGGRPAG